MTDRKFVRDLNRLIKTPKKKTLDAPAARESILGTTLIAEPVTADPGGGGGTAFPITETDIANRTYYTPEVIYSSDGIFSLTIQRIKAIKTTDTNGDPADINLAS